MLQQPPPHRPLSPAGPAPPARNAPAHLARNRRRIILAPAAADRPGPRVSAIPFLRVARQPPARALEQPPPTLPASWEHSPRSSASIKRSRASPRALPYPPHSIFSLTFKPRRPQPSHGRVPPATVLTSARNVVPESRSSPFEVAVSFAVLPSFPLCFHFGFPWPFGALFACVRELWPPTMAPVASASSSGRRDGLREFPFSPAFSRCLRISEPWPLAPEPHAPMSHNPKTARLSTAGYRAMFTLRAPPAEREVVIISDDEEMATPTPTPTPTPVAVPIYPVVATPEESTATSPTPAPAPAAPVEDEEIGWKCNLCSLSGNSKSRMIKILKFLWR
ncbi:vegetative cell wall protein gp1-like [Miscanthus floridulus]|uniref:vegetative cell wall protein gp1-like n=1 Tax=Miscanthus floridulus TaxID=154761 RepID=UPI00345742B5